MTCGTLAGYSAHIRRGEAVDAACRRARNEYQRAWMDKWRGKRMPATTRQLILDFMADEARSMTASEIVGELERFGKKPDSIRRALSRMGRAGLVKACRMNGEWRWRLC